MSSQHKIRANKTNQNKRRNASQKNRFLVNFDDSEQDESRDDQQINEKVKNFERLKNVKNSQSKLIKPSLINGVQNDQLFDQFIVLEIAKTQKSQPRTLNKFTSRLDSSLKRTSVIAARNNIFQIDCSDEQQKFPSNLDHQPKLLSFQSQPLDLCLFDSLKTENKINQEQSFQNSVFDEEINLYTPCEKTMKQSMKMSKMIYDCDSKDLLSNFITKPIKKGVRLQFQVHIQKQFFKTQYKLWFCYENKIKLLANAVHDQLNFQAQIFKFIMILPALVQRQNKFLGKLVSNFSRSEYTLFENAKQEQKNEEKILATIYSFTNHFGIKVQQLYTPKVENYEHKNIFSNSKSLRKLFQNPEFQALITKHKQRNFPEKHLKLMEKKIEVMRNTKKNGVLKDGNEKQKLLFLKMRHNVFKVYAGHGLSPFQILASSIVNLQ